jgi:hypothetical protein
VHEACHKSAANAANTAALPQNRMIDPNTMTTPAGCLQSHFTASLRHLLVALDVVPICDSQNVYLLALAGGYPCLLEKRSLEKRLPENQSLTSFSSA